MVSMLSFLDRYDLWATLKCLADATALRRYVAVPYLGKGGAALLSLRHGDVLVCALTERNARNGSVCPAEIKALQRRGVRVYLQDDLHAKIFLLGRKSIVGSANLSTSSQKNLDEAALMTTDRRVAKRLRQWFDERMQEPLTPEWLSRCAELYRPPLSDRVTRARKTRTTRGQRTRAVWLLGVCPTEYPEWEKTAYESGLKQAQVRDSRHYSVEPIRWLGEGTAFQRGDLAIQIETEGRQCKVCPHGRVINIKRTRTKAARPVAYLYLEMPKKYRTVPWIRFKNECRKIGLTLPRRVGARRIRDILQANKILSMFSPEKLGLP